MGYTRYGGSRYMNKPPVICGMPVVLYCFRVQFYDIVPSCKKDTRKQSIASEKYIFICLFSQKI